MGFFEIIKNGGLLTVKFGGSAEFLKWLAIASIGVMALGYVLGSLNGASIISKYMYNDDIRKYGSKNAGATNMMRTYGFKGGMLTSLIDILKTVIAVGAGYFLCSVLLPYLAGLFCLIGHAFPLFFGFKGGKGVIVTATTVAVTSWPTFLVLVILWGLILAFTKYVSVASMVSALMYPFILSRIARMFGQKPDFGAVVAFVMACMVIFLHRSNIGRLKNGTENKIGKKKDGDKKDGN